MGLSRQLVPERSPKNSPSRSETLDREPQRPLSRFKFKHVDNITKKKTKKCRQPYVSEKSCFFFENESKKSNSLKNITSMKHLRSNLDLLHLNEKIKSLKDKYIDGKNSPFKSFIESNKKLYNKVQSNIKERVRSGTESNIIISKSKNIFDKVNHEVRMSSERFLAHMNSKLQESKPKSIEKLHKSSSKRSKSKITVRNGLDDYCGSEVFDRDIENKYDRIRHVRKHYKDGYDSINIDEDLPCYRSKNKMNKSENEEDKIRQKSHITFDESAKRKKEKNTERKPKPQENKNNATDLDHLKDEKPKAEKKKPMTKDQKSTARLSKTESSESINKYKHRKCIEKESSERNAKKEKSRKEDQRLEKGKSKESILISSDLKKTKSKSKQSVKKVEKKIKKEKSDKSLIEKDKNNLPHKENQKLSKKVKAGGEPDQKSDQRLEKSNSQELKQTKSKTKDSAKKAEKKIKKEKSDKNLVQKDDNLPHKENQKLTKKVKSPGEPDQKSDQHLEKSASKELKKTKSKTKESAKKVEKTTKTEKSDKNLVDKDNNNLPNKENQKPSKKVKAGGGPVHKSDQRLEKTKSKELKETKSKTKESPKNVENVIRKEKSDKNLCEKDNKKDKAGGEPAQKFDQGLKKIDSKKLKKTKSKTKESPQKGENKIIKEKSGKNLVEKDSNDLQNKQNRLAKSDSKESIPRGKEVKKTKSTTKESTKNNEIKVKKTKSDKDDQHLAKGNSKEAISRGEKVKKTKSETTESAKKAEKKVKKKESEKDDQHLKKGNSKVYTPRRKEVKVDVDKSKSSMRQRCDIKEKNDLKNKQSATRKQKFDTEKGNLDSNKKYDAINKTKPFRFPSALHRSEIIQKIKPKNEIYYDVSENSNTVHRTLKGAVGDNNKVRATRTEDNLQLNTIQNNIYEANLIQYSSSYFLTSRKESVIKNLQKSNRMFRNTNTVNQKRSLREYHLSTPFQKNHSRSAHCKQQRETHRKRLRKQIGAFNDKKQETQNTSSLLLKKIPGAALTIETFFTKQIQRLKELTIKNDDNIDNDPSIKKSSIFQSIVDYTNEKRHNFQAKVTQHEQDNLSVSEKVQRSIYDINTLQLSNKIGSQENNEKINEKPIKLNIKTTGSVETLENIRIKVNKQYDQKLQKGQLSESNTSFKPCLCPDTKDSQPVTVPQMTDRRSRKQLSAQNASQKANTVKNKINRNKTIENQQALKKEHTRNSQHYEGRSNGVNTDKSKYDSDKTKGQIKEGNVETKSETFKKTPAISSHGGKNRKDKNAPTVPKKKAPGRLQTFCRKLKHVKNKTSTEVKAANESPGNSKQNLNLYKLSYVGKIPKYRYQKDSNSHFYHDSRRSSDFDRFLSDDDAYKYAYRNRNITVGSVTNGQPNFCDNDSDEELETEKSEDICQTEKDKIDKKINGKIEKKNDTNKESDINIDDTKLDTKAKVLKLLWLGCDQDDILKTIGKCKKEQICSPIWKSFKNCCLMCRNCMGLCCAVLTSLPCVGVVCMTCL